MNFRSELWDGDPGPIAYKPKRIFSRIILQIEVEVHVIETFNKTNLKLGKAAISIPPTHGRIDAG